MVVVVTTARSGVSSVSDTGGSTEDSQRLDVATMMRLPDGGVLQEDALKVIAQDHSSEAKRMNQLILFLLMMHPH